MVYGRTDGLLSWNLEDKPNFTLDMIAVLNTDAEMLCWNRLLVNILTMISDCPVLDALMHLKWYKRILCFFILPWVPTVRRTKQDLVDHVGGQNDTQQIVCSMVARVRLATSSPREVCLSLVWSKWTKSLNQVRAYSQILGGKKSKALANLL